MELFIRIVDGQPFDHPIFAENFYKAFPNIDTNNLPSEFARFERVECPYSAGPYEFNVSSYQWVDGIVKDVWTVQSMTQEEKDAKIAAAMLDKPYPSWIFDESVCSYVAPVSKPDDGKQYFWKESTLSWIEIA